MTNTVWQRFCEETTFHGFSAIYRAKHLPWKVVWAVLLTISVGFTIYEMYAVMIQFSSAPTATSQEVISQSPAFPYVVLCSLNGINSTKIEEQGILPDDVIHARMSLRDFTRELILEEAYKKNETNYSSSNDSLELSLDDLDIIELLFSIGFDQDEFIKQCLYNNKPCTSDNVEIKAQYDAEYGHCYALKPLKPQDTPGIGLILLIDIHTELTLPYYPSISDGIAVKFEDELSSAAIGQMLISPGTNTKVNFKYSEFHLQEWHGQEHMCVRDIARQYLTLPYSPTVCSLECIYSRMQDTCGCVLNRPRSELVQATNVSYCRTQTTVKCATGVRQLMFSNCSKGCLPPCTSKRFDSISSQSTFPSQGIIQWLKMNNNSNPSRWKTNYILLQIAFEDLEITKIKQYPSLTPDAFISQVGGQIGLFLGASLLSVMQVLTILLETCINRFQSKSNTFQVEKPSEFDQRSVAQ